jgi:hypothetical protein
MTKPWQNSLIKDIPVNTTGDVERQGRNKFPVSIAVCHKMYLQIFYPILNGFRIITDKVTEDGTDIFS